MSADVLADMARGVFEARRETPRLRREALDHRVAARRDRLVDRLKLSADVLADMARGVVETRRETRRLRREALDHRVAARRHIVFQRGQFLGDGGAAHGNHIVDRAEALADPLRQILRVLVDAFGQRAAVAQQRALEQMQMIGQFLGDMVAARRERLRDLPALIDDRALERLEPVAQRLVDALALHGEGDHGVAGRRRETILDRRRMLRERRSRLLHRVPQRGAQRLAMRREPLLGLAPLRLQQAGELLAMRAERLDAFAQEIVDAAGVFGDLGDGGVAMLAHARLESRESALQRLAHALAPRADIGRDQLRRRPDLVLEFGEARDDRLARRGLALHHGRRDGPALTGDDFLEGGELFSHERADALAALRNLRARAFAVLRDLRARAFAVLG